mmetsp:Transcript_110962/g.318820  ORF Transcript_110962/g.318820 Transcript_110962/m.318820 type:complete len:381 (-) Transcript_110962:540-1682(-)
MLGSYFVPTTKHWAESTALTVVLTVMRSNACCSSSPSASALSLSAASSDDRTCCRKTSAPKLPCSAAMVVPAGRSRKPCASRLPAESVVPPTSPVESRMAVAGSPATVTMLPAMLFESCSSCFGFRSAKFTSEMCRRTSAMQSGGPEIQPSAGCQGEVKPKTPQLPEERWNEKRAQPGVLSQRAWHAPALDSTVRSVRGNGLEYENPLYKQRASVAAICCMARSLETIPAGAAAEPPLRRPPSAPCEAPGSTRSTDGSGSCSWASTLMFAVWPSVAPPVRLGVHVSKMLPNSFRETTPSLFASVYTNDSSVEALAKPSGGSYLSQTAFHSKNVRLSLPEAVSCHAWLSSGCAARTISHQVKMDKKVPAKPKAVSNSALST